MAESNPNSFDCSTKVDVANKPYAYKDNINYSEDPTLIGSFVDILGTPDRNTDIEITHGSVRVYTGNVLVRPGITTVQELQVEKELYVCNDTDLMLSLIHI